MPSPAKKGIEEEPIEKMRRVSVFGNLLRERRTQRREVTPPLALKIGVTAERLLSWEAAESFPAPEKLPLVARVYEIDPGELEDAWKTSKEARRIELEARRGHKPQKPKWDDEFLGSGGHRGFLRKPRPPHL